MVEKTINWLKTHKLVVVLVIFIGYLFLRSSNFLSPMMMSSVGNSYKSARVATDSYATEMNYGGGSKGFIGAVPPMQTMMVQPESVDIDASDRKMVRNSDLSLLVQDVRSSIDQVTQYASQAGGFMVNSSVATPEQGGTGHVSIRIPADKLEATLQYLRGLAVRVVSENVTGSDVTDQFTDAQARLNTLTKTKATFEAMLDKATTVDEILRVQQSILQVQDQIDSIKGQLQYLEKTSQSSLITVYMSTDELALPYSPNEPWRPQVVFKTAVRSLLMSLRSVGSAGIWVLVYSPIALLGLIVWFVLRALFRRKVQQ